MIPAPDTTPPRVRLIRLVGGICLVVLIFLLLSTLHVSVAGRVWPDDAGQGGDMANARTPLGAVLGLMIFGWLTVAVWITQRVMHGQGMADLIGPLHVALAQFLRVAGAMLLLGLVLSALPAPAGFEPLKNIAPATWLAWLPLALLGLLVQTSAEEIVFRGYLLRHLAALSQHRVIWMGLPSAAFALLHYAPADMGDTTWIVIVWAGCFGLATADLTVRSGTLGPAIALHMVNNFGAILLVAPQGFFDGLALYSYTLTDDMQRAMWHWLPVDLMVLLCSWLVARLALRR